MANLEKNVVTYDGSSYIINGRRIWLVCGEMHYFRVPCELWRDRFKKAKANGINCISTYMAWNLHEKQEGEFDFTGDLDVEEFIRKAAEEGLYIFLRPGPYICSEWDFGGFPAWLGTKGIYYRANHPEYMKYYRRYFNSILPALAQYDVVHGGNIILIQNENEHHMNKVPGRMEYFEDITRCFREAGFDIPIIHCNRIFEGTYPDGTVECVNTWDKPAEDLTNMRLKQPGAPLLVTELWCGLFDHWGEPHNTKDTGLLVRKLIDIIGCGSQYNFYMWHGGTNFGFMGGRVQYKHFYHITSSYDMDAPLGEGGELTDKYYAVRSANIPLATMGSSFAPKTIRDGIGEQPAFSDDGCVHRAIVENNYGGKWHTITAEAVDNVQASFSDGKIHTVSLSKWGAALLPENIKVCGINIDYATASVFGVFSNTIVFHARIGSGVEMKINNEIHRFIINDKPQTAVCGSAVIVATATDLAVKAWPDGNGIILGADWVQGGNVISEKPYYRINGGNVTVHEATIRKPFSDVEIIDWQTVDVCGEMSQIDGFKPIEAPADMSELGTHYGYGWYKAVLECECECRRNIFLPYFEDRARLFLNGNPAGAWGYGPGAVREPISVKLIKGRNDITLLADNLGRFCHAWRIGEKKGLYGGIYNASALPFKLIVEDGGIFTPEMIPFMPGHLNEDEHIETLLKGKRYTVHITFESKTALPVFASFQFSNNALLRYKGKTVHFFENPDYGFGDAFIEDVNLGGNELELILWGEKLPDVKGLVTLHCMEENMTQNAKWYFKKWCSPLSRTECTAQYGQPAWFETHFKYNGYLDNPVYLKLCGGTKGQIYVNGFNLCRYWRIPPQSHYYLPYTLLKCENAIQIFDEEGICPEVVITREREWSDKCIVEMTPDVL